MTNKKTDAGVNASRPFDRLARTRAKAADDRALFREDARAMRAVGDHPFARRDRSCLDVAGTMDRMDQIVGLALSLVQDIDQASSERAAGLPSEYNATAVTVWDSYRRLRDALDAVPDAKTDKGSEELEAMLAAIDAGWLIDAEEWDDGSTIYAATPQEGRNYVLGDWKTGSPAVGVVYQWRTRGGKAKPGLWLNARSADPWQGIQFRAATIMGEVSRSPHQIAAGMERLDAALDWEVVGALRQTYDAGHQVEWVTLAKSDHDEMLALISDATPVVRFVNDVASLTDGEIEGTTVDWVRSLARSNLPDGFARFYTAEQRDAGRKAFSMVRPPSGNGGDYQGAVVDAVASALGLALVQS